MVGDLSNAPRAIQLGGIFRSAARGGTVVVLLFAETIGAGLAALVDELVPISRSSLNVASRVTAANPAFEEFFELYGMGAVDFGASTPEERVLGRSGVAVTSTWAPIGRGAVYLLPFTLPGLLDDFIPLAYDAVSAHRSAVSDEIPQHLLDLRLPGEDVILAEKHETEERLNTLSADAATLARYRLLMGTLHDQALEDLVIDALNVVLAGTGHEAQDRPDTGGPDFWIVSGESETAYGEAKGFGRNVQRRDVFQVDGHRDAIDREDADELPGLLVANIFRSSSSLEERLTPVPTHAVVRAAQSRIVILRGADLYYLVCRRRASEDAGGELLRALASRGGWLRVEPSGHELITA